MSLYLDYNASAPVDERVLEAMIEVYRNHTGNADSRTHIHGDDTRNIVENARRQVASMLGIQANEAFFTSGATESNNIAVRGLEEYAEESGKKHIITTAIEHKAVLETVKALGRKGFDVELVYPGRNGRVSAEDVLGRVRNDTLLVSVMHVNNETGIIQPVREIGKPLKEQGVLFHIDATQSCGKHVDEIREMDYDMLSFSAHKLRGPQGVGCLILRRRNYALPPVKSVMYGGQQENGIRPGTVPVALVAGCGKACEIAGQEYKDNDRKLTELKKCLGSLLKESGLSYHFNGDQNFCIQSTANICFEGVSSEALMIITKQYCSISNGSACTSKSYDPSYVLTAMGIPDEEAGCSVRISWGPDTDQRAFVYNIQKLLETAKALA